MYYIGMDMSTDRRQHERAESVLRQHVGTLWPPGSRLPPIRELAERLGLGHNSTQRAVRTLAKEGLLESSPRRGTTVSRAADTDMPMAAAEHPTDGLLLLGKRVSVCRVLADAFVLDAEEAVCEHLRRLGVNVSLITLARLGDEASLRAIDAGSDAVVLINHPVALLPAGKPGVLITTGLDHAADTHQQLDVITVDSWQGGYLAGKHMRAIGCESVAYLGVWANRFDEHTPTSAARLSGFEAGFGAKVPESHYLRSSMYQTTVGANRVCDWLAMSPRPPGVFAASDDLAIGFVHGALAHGLEAGVDYQIVGFDGQQRGQAMAGHQLTTVRVPMADMGRHAAMLLADRLVHADQPGRRLSLGVGFMTGDTAVSR